MLKYTPRSDLVSFASTTEDSCGLAQLTGALEPLLVAGCRPGDDLSYAVRVDSAASLQHLVGIVDQTHEKILLGIQGICELLTRATFQDAKGEIPFHVIANTTLLIGELAGTAVQLDHLAFCVERSVPLNEAAMADPKPAAEA